MTLRSFELFSIESAKAGEASVQIPEGTCLLAYRGSIAHGMYVPSSDPNHIDDVDLIGVVLGSAENYFGLREWGSRGTYEYKQGRWDAVFYEIRKMFSLLLQGNPNVLSTLWCLPEHYLYQSPEGKEIVASRHLFIGKHVYNAFAGYAYAQLEKMETRDPAELREYLAITAELKRRGAHPNHKGEVFEIPEPQSGVEKDVVAWSLDKLLAGLRHYQKKGENIGYMGDKRKQLVLEHGYDAKNAAHCVRLLRMCKEFLANGAMDVYRPDAAELLEIKTGKWPLDKVKALVQELFAEIKTARDASELPSQPNRDGAERLLIKLLREHFRRVGSIELDADTKERYGARS
jgi:hypothetical protein